ncbi:MAG: hypothetical protein R6V11_04870 [Ectothiorhodospiraceae bacterium]
MLTYEDCLAMTDLTEEEVEAIAEHEHCNVMAALEKGHYLVEAPDGTVRIRRMILDDIAMAQVRGNSERVAVLQSVLRRFCNKYPDCLTDDACD